MGMHRDGPNMEFDSIERNTRRQVFWSIYTYEKTLCSILGRPTVIDDRETAIQIPDAPMLEQKTMSADFMSIAFELIRTSYSVRQQAYFDETSRRERSPTVAAAESLLRNCDSFYTTIPPQLSINAPIIDDDQKARILLLHISYFYTRCMVSRDFLLQKIEMSICRLEGKPLVYPEDWRKILNLSEDCVESAHKSLECMIAGLQHSIIGYSWLDLFFVFHSVMIVCADFLARPSDQQESPKDVDRKNTVRIMLSQVRGMKQVASTYKIFNQVAFQFANIVGISVDPSTAYIVSAQHVPQEPQLGTESEEAFEYLTEIPDVQEDCFADATANLGLDFFDLNHSPSSRSASLYSGHIEPSINNEVDDWTNRTLKGMHGL